MKILTALTVVLAAIVCSSVLSVELHEKDELSIEDFLNWAQLHNKDYGNENFKEKFEIFLANHKLVQNLNTLYKGKTEFNLNKFADLTPDAFRSTVLMRPQPTPKHSQDKFLKADFVGDLPDKFDWRDRGVVTPIKDQGSLGTCWAFSTVQNIEGQFALKGNPLTNLSVEQIVDCDGNYDPPNADCGVYGGWPYLAFKFLINAGGLASEAVYPYCGGMPSCSPCEAPGYMEKLCGPPIPYCLLKDSCQAKFDKSKFVPNLKLVDWKAISDNETEIAQQLMQLGPMSVALNAELLQFYHKGVFDPIKCDPKKLDHAVLMVGFGKVTASTLHRDHSVIWGDEPYWTIKNSWGVKWGENGYFRIARGKGKCGINTQVATSVLQ